MGSMLCGLVKPREPHVATMTHYMPLDLAASLMTHWPPQGLRWCNTRPCNLRSDHLAWNNIKSTTIPCTAVQLPQCGKALCQNSGEGVLL